uniref:uncharacterized protein n=1 Tax=Semicossyphus pulcher TaxID=241346 RepID=UPI0037E7C003
MMNFALLTALTFFSLSWISVSGSVSHSVEVQSGENVTLLCSNMSKYQSLTFWFRLVNRTNISCVSVAIGSNADAEYCDGYQNGKFEMKSSISTVFLKIQPVDVIDSGLYFCGFYTNGRPVFNVIQLNVKAVCARSTYLISGILGGVTFLLVNVIIGLTVTVRKLQTGDKDEQNPQQHGNLDNNDVDAVALRLTIAPPSALLLPSAFSTAAVTFQRFTLWDTVGEVDWSDAY